MNLTDHSADNIYLNVTISNETNNATYAASSTQTYQQPVLDKPSDYYATVVKFEIPLQALPLYVFPSVPGTLNLGVVENTHGGSALPGAGAFVPGFIEPVVFRPNNTGTAISPADERYYYVYSYERSTQLVNEALLASWVAAGSPGGAGNQPYGVYDADTNLLSVVLPAAFLNAANVVAPPGSGWTIFWDDRLQTIWPSFNSFLQNDPALPDGRFELVTDQLTYDSSFIAPPPYPNPAAPTIATATTFIIRQEYPTIDYLNSVRKIIMVSHTIPIRKEYYPPPYSPFTQQTQGISNTVPILADFQLNLDNVAGSQRGIALYEAQIYRLLDLISDHPLSKIDIQLFWVDSFNVMRRLYLTKNDTATIKLAFLSKKLYKGDPAKF